MNYSRTLLVLLTFLAGTFARGIETPDIARSKLTILNGTDQTIDVLWLKSATERLPQVSIAPGAETVITTTPGHRFEIVARNDKRSATVTSVVPVQGFLFDSSGATACGLLLAIRKCQWLPDRGFGQGESVLRSGKPLLLNQMLAKRPDLREAMIKSGTRLCIMAYNEYTTDLPEFARLASEKVPIAGGVSAKDYWDARARGTGGSETDPFCSCGEENLLGYPGDPYSTECILIHEFAHAIHQRGMANVDATFDDRLTIAYEAAMKAGLWAGKYASVNRFEYFAEGVQSWFDNNRANDHDHNHVNTRELLIAYDPGLAALCGEVFGETGCDTPGRRRGSRATWPVTIRQDRRHSSGPSV